MDSEILRVTRLQDRSNWMLWKFQVKVLLNESDLLEVVNGTTAKPDDQNAGFAAWNKKDKKAQKVIVTTIGKQPTLHIMQCETSGEMWAKLHNIYEHKSNAGVHFLQQEFYSFAKDPGDDMASHIAKLENIVQQLKDMKEDISESMVITKILMTLPVEYGHFHSAWESTAEENRTLLNLMSRLMIEESRLQMRDSVEVGEALMAKKGAFKKPQSFKQKNKKPGKCFKCNKEGHWKNECPLSQSKNQSGGKFDPKSNALVCHTDESIDDTAEWYLDSGASDHMTKEMKWLSDYEEFNVPKSVTIGNGETILAYGTGDVNILAFNGRSWESKYLSKVLYVPQLKLNLFSQGQALDKGYQFKSDKVKCKLIKSGSIVAVGVRKQKLFMMMFKVIVARNIGNGEGHANVVIKQESFKVWHERLAHQNVKQVRSFLKSMDVNFSDDDSFTCDDCLIGKQHRSSFLNSNETATYCGEIIHSDVCGPMQEVSHGGSKYYVLFKDDFSHYRKVYFMKNKSEVVQHLKDFSKLLKHDTGNSLKILRSDGGGEYDNKDVRNYLSSCGVRHQKTVPYTPEQNGRAERDNRTIVEAARTMIHSKEISLKFWAEAVNTAVYVLNRTGSSSVVGATPYDLWFGKPPRIDHLRVFGSEVFIHVPKQHRRKWDKKSNKGIFVGYPEDTKGYRVWNNDTMRVQVSCDVKFKEATDEVCISMKGGDNKTIASEVVQKDDDLVNGVLNEGQDEQYYDAPSTSQEQENDHRWENSIKDRLRNSKKSTNLVSVGDNFVFLADYQEPVNYDKAIQTPERDKWVEAMDEEISALSKNSTWELCDLPNDKKLVDNRWVFKIKFKKNGTIERYKARLVARGFTQEYGVDYLETFSPVVRFTSVRTLLAIAAQERLILKQFDIKTAFLYGELQEDIFMEQPEGYSDGSGRVCKLVKSLYGLKQSSRCWNQKFSKFLNDFGLVPSKVDPCVFIQETDGDKIMLAIYIDDGLLAASNQKLIETLINYLMEIFEIKVGEPDCYLGMEIEQQQDGSLFVSQRNYAVKVLQRFNMEDCNPISTPADPGQFSDEKSEMVEFPYRQAVGSLMYLAVATRPDISYAVGYISRFMENPNQQHVKAVKRVIKYIKGTTDYGIIFKCNQKNFVLSVFSDADYAGDQVTRRSTTGYIFLLGSGAISWGSERQKSVALSTTESEYVAASQTIKELVWIRRLLFDLQADVMNNVPMLFMDNQSAIKLVKNPEYHKRSKHIDVKYHFIREKYEEGVFNLEYVASEDQLGDIFTKALNKVKFEKFCQLIGVCALK